MKVLITGGAGFIGRHLQKKLLTRGVEIVILDNFLTNIHGHNPILDFPSDVQVIKDDILNIDLYNDQLSDVEWIFHLAAETGTGESMYRVAQYAQTNILGTAKIIDFFATANPDAGMTLASSRSVYGEGEYHCCHGHISFPKQTKTPFFVKLPLCECGEPLMSRPTSETAQINPASIYASSKYSQETLLTLSHFHRNNRLNIFRLQNVYGPGQSLKNPYTGILAIFAKEIINNRSVSLFERGKPSRDFVHVDDVVSIMSSIYDQNVVLNVGTGRSVTVRQVAEEICKYYGKELSQIQETDLKREGDIFTNYASTTELANYFPVNKMKNFSTGVIDFLDAAMADQLYGFSGYENSINELRDNNLLHSADSYD